MPSIQEGRTRDRSMEDDPDAYGGAVKLTHSEEKTPECAIVLELSNRKMRSEARQASRLKRFMKKTGETSANAFSFGAYRPMRVVDGESIRSMTYSFEDIETLMDRFRHFYEPVGIRIKTISIYSVEFDTTHGHRQILRIDITIV